MRKIILFILLLVSARSIAQYPPGYTGISARYQWIAGIFKDGLHVPQICGFPVSRTGVWVGDGQLMMDTCGSKLYIRSEGVWKALADSTGAGVDSVYYRPGDLTDTLFAIKDGTEYVAYVTDKPVFNGLLSGGIVTWDSLYIYHISPAVYRINGLLYTSPATTVTLDAAHASLDRLDAFVVTTSSTAIVVTGTAAATPVLPNIDPSTQLQVSFALVTAATTAPAVTPTQAIIYDEGTEWTTTSNSGNIVVGSTNNPYKGTKDIEATSAVTTNRVVFVPTTETTLSNYNALTFKIRSKGNWTNNRKLQFALFVNHAVFAIALPFGQGSYGFNSSQTATYQNITIPLSDFAVPSGAVDSLKFTVNNTSGSIGFYMDDIQLQSATTTPSPGQNFLTSVFRKTATDSVFYVAGGVTTFAYRDSTGGVNIYNSNGILTGNRTLTGLNDARSLTIDSVNSFAVRRTNIDRFLINSTNGYMVSPNGLSQYSIGNGLASININSSANYYNMIADSSEVKNKISYSGNIHSTFGPYSLITKAYGDSAYGGSATPTWQQVLTAGSNLTSNNTVTINANSFSINGTDASHNTSYSQGNDNLSMTRTPAVSGISSIFKVTDSVYLNSQNTSGPESRFIVYPDSIVSRPYGGDYRVPGLIQGQGTKQLRYNPALGQFTWADTTGGGQTSLEIGITPITSGSNGRVLYDSSGILSSNKDFFWDKTNHRLGINTNIPSAPLHVAIGSGLVSRFNGSGINSIYTEYSNTGGGLFVGLERSAGGGIFTGALSYASVMGTTNATALQLATNNNVRITVSSAGDITTAANSNVGIGGLNAGYKFYNTGNSLFDGEPQFESQLKLKDISQPATPAAGYAVQYINNDKAYIKNDAGIVMETTNTVNHLITNTTAVGNVGTGEDDLITYSVPAATLINNGDYMEFTMTFTLAANANNKQIKVYFGATQLYVSTAQAQNDGTLTVTGRVIRTGAATQVASVEINTDATLFTDVSKYTTPAETLSGAITLKATGEGTSNNDISQKILTVKYVRAN